MSNQPPDYAVGYGKPPLHSRFRKGSSGNPQGGRHYEKRLASVLIASITRPRPGAIYNVCDDEPAAPETVNAMPLPWRGPAPPLVPFEAAGLSPMARSFYDDNKRVANALIKRELGVALRYPNYRAGLAAMLAAKENPQPPPSA